MERVEEYTRIVRRVIDEYAQMMPPEEGVEIETNCDDAHGHFQLMCVGWKGLRRVHGIVLHLDVKGDKVWIQHDGTEQGVALDLEEAGIPKDHIVLAFHAPYKRPHTGYAVA